MFISRMEITPKAASQPEMWRHIADPYQFHRLLWQSFSDTPQRRRDFIYRQEGRTAYVLSHRPPLSAIPGWRLEHKVFAPKLAKGQRLGFVLRANPVVSRRDENGRQHRHDLVMETKTKLKNQGTPPEHWPNGAELARQAGLQWLSARGGANGFSLDEASMRADGYRQMSFPKKGRKVSISVLDLSGWLTVEDPDAFLEMVVKGIGPAKGFGCGLMLIRRA